MARQELARFLRDRRTAIDPVAAGVGSTSVRRTAGLRREEVAARAAMSVDYYVRLEQARGSHPSPRVLAGLARALGLDDAQRHRLFALADTPVPPPPGPSRTVRPHVAALLNRVDAAAIVTNAAYDVVAHNGLAGRLLGDLSPGRNLARRRFLDNRRWSSASDEFAEVAVSRLRAAVDRYPHDAGLATLVSELHAGSVEFGQVWEANPVRAAGHRTKTVDHPEVGRLELSCDVLTVPDDDQQVVFVTAAPGSPSARALRRLLT